MVLKDLQNFLTVINWRDKTEITRPVDECKWIGCLCWFWNDEKERAVLGELAKIYKPGFLYYKKTMQ